MGADGHSAVLSSGSNDPTNVIRLDPQRLLTEQRHPPRAAPIVASTVRQITVPDGTVMVMYGTYDPFVLADIFLYAFDLLELDGRALRREPLETRKATLASLLRGSGRGLRLVEHLAHDGESVFRHACKMGLEGIVSKRLGSP
jgi:hypothetical protein